MASVMREVRSRLVPGREYIRPGLVWIFCIIVLVIGASMAQGQQQTLDGSSTTRGTGRGPMLDLGPSNPLGLPRASGGDWFSFSSGMFDGIIPQIPNLSLGFYYGRPPHYYNLQRTTTTTLFTADYFHPIRIGSSSVLLAEAHGDFENLLGTLQGEQYNRLDLDFLAAYRRLFGNTLMLGAYVAWDFTRFHGEWRPTGGMGLEMVARGPGRSVTDLTFNYYGTLFPGYTWFNDVKEGRGNFELEAGYTQPIFDRALALRLDFRAYRFDLGDMFIDGWGTGAEFATRNGLFTVTCDYAHDRINDPHFLVGGTFNVGLQLENLLRLESPFVMPEPIYRDDWDVVPGDVVRSALTRGVNRNAHHHRPPIPPVNPLLAYRTVPCSTWYPFFNPLHPRFPSQAKNFKEGPVTNEVIQKTQRIVVIFHVDLQVTHPRWPQVVNLGHPISGSSFDPGATVPEILATFGGPGGQAIGPRLGTVNDPDFIGSLLTTVIVGVTYPTHVRRTYRWVIRDGFRLRWLKALSAAGLNVNGFFLWSLPEIGIMRYCSEVAFYSR